MNKGYSYGPRGKERSPPRRDRFQTQDMNSSSISRHQPAMKQDINIDDFGDMGSDEDDFQALTSNFMPPKPPSKPQYNTVPFGLLRDDDDLVEDEDYDGVPLDDTVEQDSPKKQPWLSSPAKPQLGANECEPITVLGSGNRPSSHFSVWSNVSETQNVTSQHRPGIGSSLLNSYVSKLGDKDILGVNYSNLGTSKNMPSLLGTDCNSGTTRSFTRSRVDATPLVEPGSRQTSSTSFVHGKDDSHRFLKSVNEPSSSRNTIGGLIRCPDGSNPFIKSESNQTPGTHFGAAKDKSSASIGSPDKNSRWDDKYGLAQSHAVAKKDRERGFPQSSKGQAIPDQMFERTGLTGLGVKEQLQPDPVLPSTSTMSASAQLELLQAAALQQALAGLTQLGPQSGLNLIGAQNLLVQASQNPSLAAALLASGGLLSAKLSSAQPNTSSHPAANSLLKPAVPTGVPDMHQSTAGLLTYPLRSTVKGSVGSIPQKKSVPDGSGSSRYPEPHVNSLVFDPKTGYRFDASTGLHYDANSGYFFNSELKVFLRWDKFTQTYLKVDNPPPIPRFVGEPSDQISYYVKDSAPSTLKLSSFPNTSYLKESTLSSSTLLTGGLARQTHQERDRLREGSISSVQNQNSTAQSMMINDIPIDVSKPPPPLPQTTTYSKIEFSPLKSNPVEQKPVVLPNYAETSLFNKLRKAKLAQTAQGKTDRKWGTPDPLLEATQKHATETDKSHDMLNLKEILQRSRQFMQQNSVTPSSAGDTFHRQERKDSTRSQSGDQMKARSRSRSVGRPFKDSRSIERPGIRRGKSSVSPPKRKPSSRSPDRRRHCRPDSRDTDPKSRGRRRPSLSPPTRRKKSTSRSPSYRTRGRSSLSPASKRKKSISRGRSPSVRVCDRASPTPEGRLRSRVSKERSPHRKFRKSNSPCLKISGPVSRGRSPERPQGRRSISRELRKKRINSSTPNRTAQRSQSPKVKVVLNQSPGGSQIRMRSPGHGNKRLAERGVSPERSKVRQKLSPNRPEKLKTCKADKIVLPRPLRERPSVRENLPGSSGKDKISELKPIPYDTPQKSNKKSSDKGKHVSGYKSFSNLRNQGKYKHKEKETVSKRTGSQQNEDKSSPTQTSSRLHKEEYSSTRNASSIEIDLTADSGDERCSRANHRLVSERTFAGSWERSKPHLVSARPSTKKIDAVAESVLPVQGIEGGVKNDSNGRFEIEESQTLEDPSEFDFLMETLDDDKDSTVVDEYEEILDYQDLQEESEIVDSNSTPKYEKPDAVKVTLSSKESIESSVTETCIESGVTVAEPSTSGSLGDSEKCHSVERSELVEIPSENSASSEYTGTQDEEGSKYPKDEVSSDKSSCAPDLESSNDITDKETKETDILVEKKSLGGASLLVESKSCDFPVAQTITRNVEPEAGKDGNDSRNVDKGTTEIERASNESNDNIGHSENREVEESGTELLDNEEWNIVDSVEDQKEVAQLNIFVDSSTNEGSCGESNVKVDRSGVPLNTVSTESRVEKDQLNPEDSCDVKKADSQIKQDEGALEKSEDSEKVKANDKPLIQSQEGEGPHSEMNSLSENEESAKQVRSVSDIEKFLLLSSQEVEAKRELGIEQITSKNEKKSGIFSRLGEKLPADETGDQAKVVIEIPAETDSNAITTKKSLSPAPKKVKPGPAKSTGVTKKITTKGDPKDPVGSLFDDSKPTSQILIGPMNFIEPLPSFQQFTQKFMKLMLQEQGIKFKQVYVCHEDVTGAPYHYILVLFDSVKAASNYFNKCKGKFKCNEKLFEKVPGYLKHKLIHGVESFVHYTTNNWVCKTCKKGNFPPRSLCFGCFQHRNPEGFSPLSILEFVFPKRPSNFVGTPKLKFFVTKEEVINSLPPLDGFDIKNIVMIMDEEMEFPAGICVFEMYDFIDAGKFKKFLLNRSIEAVSVEVYEKPELVLADSKSPVVEDASALENEAPSIPSSSRRDRTDSLEGRGKRDDSPKFTVKVPKGRSPSPMREVRATHRLSSPSCKLGAKVRTFSSLPEARARDRSPSPLREGRVPRGRSPSPLRQGRVPRGRSPSPFHPGRVPRGRSPSPLRGGRIHRGLSPSPLRERRIPRGRSPSPLRSRISKDRGRSRSPRHVSRDSRESRPTSITSRGRPHREVTPKYEETRRHRSREGLSRYSRSPVRHSPPKYRTHSPAFDPPRRRSPSPRYRTPSPVRPIKPDGRGDWRYPPPDPRNFKFEPRSGLDYDPTTTLYYEPKSCCFYNDDTNEWLEYDPRTERYIKVR